MPELILNDAVATLPAQDTNLLDWLRDQGLTAAKPGCRGGDCGACQVLVGEVDAVGAESNYRAVNSCLLSTDLVADCHVITAEGLNFRELTPVQQSLVDTGAIQCGYCTPGLVVCLTGALLAAQPLDAAAAGNLCRCTGYAGIRRAIEGLVEALPDAPMSLHDAARRGLLPKTVADAGDLLRPPPPESSRPTRSVVGGNTDWSVRHPHAAASAPRLRLHRQPGLRTIVEAGETISIGAAVSVAELQRDPVIGDAWPELPPFLNRFGSPAVRNLASVGGNLANASPAADLAVILLALQAEVSIDGPTGRRDLPLADFFLGYQRNDLAPGEVLVRVCIPRNRDQAARMHCEKVARRAHDDVASVASTMVVTGGDPGTFGSVALSAGGVAPTPILLPATSAALTGRPVGVGVREALDLIPVEIAPIGDVRGSAGYKTRLLRHLVLAHVAELYPGFDVREYLT